MKYYHSQTAAYEKHRRFHGEVMLMYVMWYGLGRFFIEGLRTDSLMVGPFRISQVVAAASTLAALALWLVLRKKEELQRKRREEDKIERK